MKITIPVENVRLGDLMGKYGAVVKIENTVAPVAVHDRQELPAFRHPPKMTRQQYVEASQREYEAVEALSPAMVTVYTNIGYRRAVSVGTEVEVLRVA